MLHAAALNGRLPKKMPDALRAKIGMQRSVASQLFLLDTDLAALMTYAVCVTGRNVETLKEIRAKHAMLDDQVVALQPIKRRRGKSKMFDTVHWETGSKNGSQLKTPGGFYLLLLELTARSLQFSKSSTAWSIWINGGNPKGQSSPGGQHIDPFATSLSRDLLLRHWVARKGLVCDDGNPLVLRLSRLKKTEDIRRTRSVGGHLPSAALTNGIDTLFRDYLMGDPSIHEWAEEILDTALRSAESAARSFAPPVRAELAATARAMDTTPRKVKQALTGKLDTIVASCLDFDHHPDTGRPCTAAFHTCLLCSNALVMQRHLPALKALVEDLQTALNTTDAQAWCQRYGTLWLVLTRHILPKFTDGEINQATSATSGVLPALDGLREHR